MAGGTQHECGSSVVMLVRGQMTMCRRVYSSPGFKSPTVWMSINSNFIQLKNICPCFVRSGVFDKFQTYIMDTYTSSAGVYIAHQDLNLRLRGCLSILILGVYIRMCVQ